MKTVDTASSGYGNPGRRSPLIDTQAQGDTFGFGQGLRNSFTSKPQLLSRPERRSRAGHDSRGSALSAPSGRESVEPIAQHGRAVDESLKPRTRTQHSSEASHNLSMAYEEDGFTTGLILDFSAPPGPIDCVSFGPPPLFTCDLPTLSNGAIAGSTTSIRQSIKARILRQSFDQRLTRLNNPIKHASPGGEARSNRDDVHSKYTEDGVPMYQDPTYLVHNHDGVASAKISHPERKPATERARSEYPSSLTRKQQPHQFSSTHTADQHRTKTITSAALPILLQIAESEGIVTKFYLAPRVATTSAVAEHRKTRSYRLHHPDEATVREKLGSTVGSLRRCRNRGQGPSVTEIDKVDSKCVYAREYAASSGDSICALNLPAPNPGSAIKS